MDSFTDYYTVLGIEASASNAEIKAAFKKLALRYHPDVNKSADAQERMRVILRAYQTLNDPEARREYDAQRAAHLGGASGPRPSVAGQATRGRQTEVSPRARRDRQRHYDFPTLDASSPANVYLGDVSYSLSAEQAERLRGDGLLRGVAPGGQQSGNRLLLDVAQGWRAAPTRYCHRCRHRWTPARGEGERLERYCPSCGARDWPEYLLLRCVHCCAVFESEQIRYEIGGYNYGDGDLCPPYELFPLCPYCGSARWCPAEDARVEKLRASRRRGWLRFF